MGRFVGSQVEGAPAKIKIEGVLNRKVGGNEILVCQGHAEIPLRHVAVIRCTLCHRVCEFVVSYKVDAFALEALIAIDMVWVDVRIDDVTDRDAGFCNNGIA